MPRPGQEDLEAFAVMTDFEERLRAAMESSVAGEQPPPELVQRVRRRHRRHIARVAATGIVVMAAVLVAVPLAGAARLGGGIPTRTVAPAPDARALAPTPAVRGQYYGCTSQTFGDLGPRWRQGSTQAGPLWFINKGIAPNFSFHNRNGTLRPIPIIVLVRDNSIAWVQPSGAGKQYFRFLPGLTSMNQYALRDGKAEATFAGCSDQNSMYGSGLTEFYIGVIVRGPRCITLDVRTTATRQPTPARLTFGKCGTGN
jgi:hypothetical protein